MNLLKGDGFNFEYCSKHFGYWTTGKCPGTLVAPGSPGALIAPWAYGMVVIPATLQPGLAVREACVWVTPACSLGS